MLPPGHIASGYLTALGILQIVQPELSIMERQQLLALGALAGFAPDLDTFYAFLKVRSFTIQNNAVNHRTFISHTPAVWLAGGLVVCLVAPNPFWQLAGLIIWLGAWSHFILDSIQHGVMWLWPLSGKRYAFRKPGELSTGIVEPKFFKFWLKMVAQYPKELPYTFVLEIIIIVSALIILFSKYV